MDFATLIGLAMAFGLVGWSCASGAGLGAFVDVPSVAIVFGGTIGATLINYPLTDFLTVGKVIKNAFFHRSIDPQRTIIQMVEYSTRARREGILALEEAADRAANPFLRKGLQLAVDGEDPQAIQNILDTEIYWLRERHRLGADLFATMGALAPAFGLIGTLIGLVGMLQGMNDPSTIGPSMATALITTFYGAMIANVICNPIAGKLRTRSTAECLIWELTREGVLAISTGDNPRMVEQRLIAYLAPKLRGAEAMG